MFRTLVIKEILNNLLNLRFSLAYFICTFLLVGSATIMISDYISEKKIYDVNNNYYSRRYSEIFPGEYLWSQKTALRKPVLTKIIAIGGEKDPDVQADVAPEFSPYFHGDFKRNPLTNLFPTVDMVFIVGVILSLLIFMLTYDAISGEREEGTLKVLLSCPVPRDIVMLAKWLGGYISLAIPFITSWLVLLLILVFVPSIGLSADAFLRIGLMFTVCMIYVAVVFSLSIMVSTLARDSTTAALVLLLVWAAAILIIPSISTPLAYLAKNPPGIQESQIEMRRAGVVDWVNFDARLDAYIKEQTGKTRTDIEVGQFEQLSGAYEKTYIKDKVDMVIAAGRKATRDQTNIDDLARWIARISPYGCMANACVEIAGTGMQHERDLRASLEEFAKKAVVFGLDSRGPDRNFDIIAAPRFYAQKSSTVSAVEHSLPDLIVLFAMGTLFFMVAYTRFMRLESI